MTSVKFPDGSSLERMKLPPPIGCIKSMPRQCKNLFCELDFDSFFLFGAFRSRECELMEKLAIEAERIKGKECSGTESQIKSCTFKGAFQTGSHPKIKKKLAFYSSCQLKPPSDLTETI